MRNVIDNPGGGNCGYYGFAIALIEQIQQQVRANGRSALFDKWQGMGLKDVLLTQIQAFDLAALARSPRRYQKELLDKLQQSLRELGFEQARQAAQGKHVDQSSLFNKFCAIVMGEADAQYNELQTPAVHKFIRQQNLPPNSSFSRLQAVFKADVAKPSSVILQAALRVTEPGYWATHTELAQVAEALGVNLKVAGMADGKALTDRPTITLVNQGNYHWQTQLQAPIPKQAHAPRMFAPTVSLREEILKLKIDVDEKKQINLAHIDTAKSNDDETDKDFAKRLQEAEIRRFRA